MAWLSSKFLSTTYLKTGSAYQRCCLNLLTEYRVLARLEKYTPVIAGTIPIGINVEGSDIDILCHWHDKEEFVKELESLFEHYPDFLVSEKKLGIHDSVIGRFDLDEIPVEIVGQPVPVSDQVAYRHMIIEASILEEQGEGFRQVIIRLKNRGMKTEPAFAHALGLTGDPYQAILNLAEKYALE